MQYKGVTYDVGTEYVPNILTKDHFNLELVNKDMDAIKNQLNCNSVRIYGKESQKLILAAESALQQGLNVWLSPRLINENQESTLSHLKWIATAFEILKQKYPSQELIFIIGGELTIDMAGLVPGDFISERIKQVLNPLAFIKSALGIKPKYEKTFNQFLQTAFSVVKEVFSGKITYSAGIWEKVDWSYFDFISINLYKASFNKASYNRTLKKMVSTGKPLIITEFGCCAYEGADQKGPDGYGVLDFSKNPPLFKEKCIRNEKVQADYIIDLLQTYDKEHVTGAFVFDFCMEKYTHNATPENDYDLAAFGITKSFGKGTWTPKESFYEIGKYYKTH
jgi:hypothetical protein